MLLFAKLVYVTLPMKLPTMPMLLLVLGLVGTLARNPTGQQELSAAHDAGLGANSLAQIEASVLSLAREKSSNDNSTLESIALIEQYIGLMKNDVLIRANATQAGLDQSWYNLVNCKLNLSTSANTAVLNATHRDCSQQESSLRQTYTDCTSLCATHCITTQADCGLFCEVDTYGGCHFEGPVKPDDVNQDFREWDGLQYYQRLANDFDDLLADWTTKKNTCKDTLNTMQNCYLNCETTQGSAYETKKAECTEHQYDLETAACPEKSSPCAAYSSCHDALTDTYLADSETAQLSEASWKTEYRGLMRIQCLLDAYSENAISGADIQAGLDACEQAVFTPCEEQISLCLTYHTAPAKESCSSMANETLLPGSSYWVEAYYTNMPEGTTWEGCGAPCCLPDGATPPIPDSLPAANCSLCTNESNL